MTCHNYVFISFLSFFNTDIKATLWITNSILRFIFQRLLSLVRGQQDKLFDNSRQSHFSLNQSKPHPNATSRPMSKSQKCIWMSSGFGFFAKMFRIKVLSIGIMLCIKMDGWNINLVSMNLITNPYGLQNCSNSSRIFHNKTLQTKEQIWIYQSLFRITDSFQ